jgi:hypothetical protein
MGIFLKLKSGRKGANKLFKNLSHSNECKDSGIIPTNTPKFETGMDGKLNFCN